MPTKKQGWAVRIKVLKSFVNGTSKIVFSRFPEKHVFVARCYLIAIQWHYITSQIVANIGSGNGLRHIQSQIIT